MKRRSMIKSMLAAPIVGIKPKEELFVVETPDTETEFELKGGSYHGSFQTVSSMVHSKEIPKGHWKLARIVFEKVSS